LPKIHELLSEAEDDLLAFYAFPPDHWPKLRSTNPLERVDREIGRRTDVVGIFPNDRSLIRLAASVVIEQNHEWLVGKRYLSQHTLETILTECLRRRWPWSAVGSTRADIGDPVLPEPGRRRTPPPGLSRQLRRPGRDAGAWRVRGAQLGHDRVGAVGDRRGSLEREAELTRQRGVLELERPERAGRRADALWAVVEEPGLRRRRLGE
jgi:Transposase, Mutator family